MPINILMPALSPTMTEGKLAKWVRKEGDTVKAGDVIAEIETDKATMEVEAVDEGKIGKILIAEGSEGVAVNTPIAVLLEEGEDASAMSVAPAAPKQTTTTNAAPAAAPAKQEKTTMAATQATKQGNRVFASPLAKRMAAQMGVDLSTIRGTGPRGRIVKEDLAHGGGVGGNGAARPMAAAAPASAPRAMPSGPNGKNLADLLGMKYTAIPNNNIRKVVAKRLVESKQTVPHFYLTVEFRIDALLAARQQINDAAKGKFKLSVNDFVIKACANALKAYPAANVSWTDDAILQFEHADISVAVATPNGLITPIVKAAETKGLKQISEEVKDLAGRAREGKLKPEEFQGGTFSVSNLGMYGVKEFDAIINPPQACILAIGAGEEKPFVENGEIKIGNFMSCTLSVDHRAVDGAIGAEYLQVLRGFIENPVSMLV